MQTSDDFHCFRTDPLIRWQGVADVLERDAAAWTWALANIGRWQAAGRLHPWPLTEWKSRILKSQECPAYRRELLETMRLPPQGGKEDQLRSCSPFVGGPFAPAKPMVKDAGPYSIPTLISVS